MRTEIARDVYDVVQVQSCQQENHGNEIQISVNEANAGRLTIPNDQHQDNPFYQNYFI